MNARITDVALVLALATVLTVAIAMPVLQAPGERLFGMEIVGRQPDPFTVMEQFGQPVRVGVYLQPVADVPGAWLTRATGSVAAYAWLTLLTFPLSAVAAFLLARYLTLSRPFAAFAAIAYAFSPFHLAHAAYHYQIAQTQWVPLYFLALWYCVSTATPAAVAMLAVSAIAVSLSNFYGGFIVAVMTPVAIAAYWFFTARAQPQVLRRLAITATSLAVIAGVGIAYIWFAARTVLMNRTSFAFGGGELIRYSATWWSYLVPPVEHPWLGAFSRTAWTNAGVSAGLLEQQVSLGWGVVALAAIALWQWKRLLDPKKAPGAFSGTVPMLLTVAIAAFICSASPTAVLYRVAPMFRAYARFGVVVQLMAVLLAGIGAQRLWQAGTRAARATCAALLLLVAFEYAVWPPDLWRDVLPTQAHRWAAKQSDQVHVLDCAMWTPESASEQWLSGYRVAPLRDLAFDDCLEPHLVDKILATQYTHLLVRQNTTEARWFARHGSPEGFQEAVRFNDSAVFAIVAPRRSVYTGQMTGFFPRECDETWTWRWMGADASWEVMNQGDRPVAAFLDVEMSAFHRARGLRVRLDGEEVQTLTVNEARAFQRIGPLVLTRGPHALLFQAMDAPTVANDLIANGDRRPLSIAVGTWRWTTEDAQP